MRTLALIFCIAVASPAIAGESIYDQCLRAIEENDAISVALNAALITSALDSISEQNIAKAEKCVSANNGVPSVFDRASNSFVPAAEIQRQEDADQRAARNQLLIDTDIWNACKGLYERDMAAAMTNSVCVLSFRQIGHPLLD